jgi:ABC-2 type transport system ATP-binding protein
MTSRPHRPAVVYCTDMEPAISIRHLSKSFGSQSVLSDFSIDVYPGDVFAFLGSNGSGKTTTFRCLLGIFLPNDGDALIFGRRYSSAMRNDVGYLPEERGIYTKSSVKDVLHYFATLHGVPSGERERAIDEYLERVELADHSEKKVGQLSSGMQQKVQIGTAVIHRPEVLILDEPFKGLDPLNRQLFLDMFEDLRKGGTTILYSTHVVDEVQRLANRLVMIKAGKRVLYGTVDEVRNTYGTNTITVSFSGDFPENPKLYRARREHNFAEVTPQKGVEPEEILKFLVTAPGLSVREFDINRPTLNSIFIQRAKQEELE